MEINEIINIIQSVGNEKSLQVVDFIRGLQDNIVKLNEDISNEKQRNERLLDENNNLFKRITSKPEEKVEEKQHFISGEEMLENLANLLKGEIENE